MNRRSTSALACALALAAVGCEQAPKGVALPPTPAAAEPAPVPVRTGVLARSRLVLPIEATGTAVAARSADISTLLAAKVEAIPVEEGQTVEAGDLLVRLDDRQARLQWSQANASAAAAEVGADQVRSDQQRLSPLAERGTIARSRIEQLGAQAEAAEAQAKAAKSAAWAAMRMVADAKVEAPFAGTVVDVGVELGEMANRAQYLVRLVDLTTLEVTARVPARDLPHLAVGDPVVARLPDLDRVVDAALVRLGVEVDPATRTVEVVARIDNPDRAIPSGIFTELRITPRAGREGLVVPRSAVAHVEGRSVVYAVDGGVARARPVEIRPLDSGRVELMGGVEAGATLVLAGVDGLLDGAPVAAAEQHAARDEPAPADEAAAAVEAVR